MIVAPDCQGWASSVLSICDGGRFSLYSGIKLIGINTFSQTLDLFYNYVVEHIMDFLLVDYELEKVSVDYKGIDVLRKIRNHKL